MIPKRLLPLVAAVALVPAARAAASTPTLNDAPTPPATTVALGYADCDPALLITSPQPGDLPIHGSPWYCRPVPRQAPTTVPTRVSSTSIVAPTSTPPQRQAPTVAHVRLLVRGPF